MGRLATVVIAGAVAAGMVTVHPATRQPYQTVARGTPIDHVAVIGDSYTTGTDEGGWGSNTWTNRTWLTLAHQGVQVAPEVASEGRAGYVVRGDHGSVFEDLTNRAVHPDDALVVFFGSRNDHGVDPAQMAAMAHDTLDLARRIAPTAKLLVIGPITGQSVGALIAMSASPMPMPTEPSPDIPSIAWVATPLSAELRRL